MKKYTVKQLPSGFWSVWFGSVWANAALPSKKAALEFIESMEGGAQ